MSVLSVKLGGGGIIKTAFSQKLLNTSSGHLDGKEIVLTRSYRQVSGVSKYVTMTSTMQPDITV